MVAVNCEGKSHQKYIASSDESELEFSDSSRAELWSFLAKPSWTEIFLTHIFYITGSQYGFELSAALSLKISGGSRTK